MSFSECITIRNNKKLEWEKDFEKNYKQAANHIAQRFAQDCFADVAQSLTNPCVTLYSSERKFAASLSVDISLKHKARRLHCYLVETKLPPFIEWITEFSGNNKDVFDRGYFHPFMDRIAKAAEPVLQQTCKELVATCIIEGNKLNFEAKNEPQSISMSLCLWFDSDTL